MIQAWLRLMRGLGLVISASLLFLRPNHAPWAILVTLALSLEPLIRAKRGARGTALGAATVWSMMAVGLGAIAEALALTERVDTGLPWAGHFTYLTTLATLAALISVLNARTPGGGAWAVLMALLILVFLIPWMENAGLRRSTHALARLSLSSPWTIFYGLLVLAGVTNYLPTRFGPAAAWLGLGFGLEFLGLTRTEWSPSTRALIWIAVPWTLAAAIATAELCGRFVPVASSSMDAIWFWFRDHWGVVWALRVMERFNRSAEMAKWPVRLTWHGSTVTAASVPAAAETTLKGLLRRFARPERIDHVASEGTRPLVKGPVVPEDKGGGETQ